MILIKFKPRGAKGRKIEAQRCPERKRKEDRIKFKTGGGPEATQRRPSGAKGREIEARSTKGRKIETRRWARGDPEATQG